jgi:DNA helicase II / ATP-dependent DNA helicase PcrA
VTSVPILAPDPFSLDPLGAHDAHALLAGLNPRQMEAVTATEGPVLVLAGAGSGKTRVLVTRAAHLIRNLEVDPGQILGITFTRKAAAEMRERLGRLVPGEAAARVTLSTFHALGASILRDYGTLVGLEPGFTILDEDDAATRIRRLLKEQEVARNSPGERPREVAARISRAKAGLASHLAARATAGSDSSLGATLRFRQGDEEWIRGAADSLETPDTPRFLEQYRAYQARLAEDNAVDYDDLVCLPLLLLVQRPEIRRLYNHRWRYLMVDEYQDTDHNQDLLLGLLAGEARNLMVVGDDSQAIYSWRGARVENIQTFPERHEPCRRITLDENYRSTGMVLRVANSVLLAYPDAVSFQKTLWTRNPVGSPARVWTCMNQEVEAEAVVADLRAALATGEIGSLSEVMILFRLNSIARCVEEELRRFGVPYRMIGALPLHERRGVKDLLSYLRLAVNPKDAGSFERAVGSPARGIGPATVEVLGSYARANHLSILDAASRADQIKGIRKKQARILAEFAEQVRGIAEVGAAEGPAAAIHRVVEVTGIRQVLAASLAAAEEEEDEEQEKESMQRVHEIDDFLLYAEEFCRTERIRRYGGGGTAADAPQYRGQIPLAHFLDQLATLGQDHENGANHESVPAEGEERGHGRVTLMSVHGSKGLEARRVYVLGVEESVFPLHGRASEGTIMDDNLAEEARLFYVAVTRAMESLTLSCAHSREIQRDNPRPMIRSRFVNTLPETLYVLAVQNGA